MEKIKSTIEISYELIYNLFRNEMNNGGLLEDVSTFITSSNFNEHIDTPLVWLEKKNIERVSTVAHSNATIINMPFSLVCGAEIITDVQTAETDALNLACRCMTTLFKNEINPQQTLADHIYFKGFTIDNIEPTGNFEIINKTTLIPATKIDFTFQFEINWMIYQNSKGEEIDFNHREYLEEITYSDIELKQ